ncbi:MAG: PIN domain-containing protein [Candidatus Micrarchaeota archaeon]
MRVYLDSNVFISFVKSEIDGAFNLRFVQAEDFFSFCRGKKIGIVLSDHFLFEVAKIAFSDKKSVEKLFLCLGVSVEFVKDASSEQAKIVSQKTGIHRADAVHVAAALESNCNAIVSWNKKDMEKAGRLISCFTPLEFVQGTL